MSARAPFYVRVAVRCMIAVVLAGLILLALWQPLVASGVLVGMIAVDVVRVARRRRARLRATV